MTDQEKQNVSAIVARANAILEADKRKATKDGDIAKGIHIANAQADMERQFRERGIILNGTPQQP